MAADGQPTGGGARGREASPSGSCQHYHANLQSCVEAGGEDGGGCVFWMGFFQTFMAHLRLFGLIRAE